MRRKNNPQKITKKINLPSFLKTGQLLSISVQLGQFTISFSLECSSNTLTTFNKGVLSLKEITFLNAKVDKFKLFLPLQNFPTEDVIYPPFEKAVANNMTLLNQSIQVQRKMKELLKAFIVVEAFTENSNKKLFAKIYLSQMSLTSKFEKDIEESPKVIFVDQLYAYSN